MRKSIDGLAAIVQDQFNVDPFEPALFIFCGRKADRIKALMWENDGFVLLYKRLASGNLNRSFRSATIRSGPCKTQ